MTSAGFRNAQRALPTMGRMASGVHQCCRGVSHEQFLLSLLLRIFQRHNDERVLFFFFFPSQKPEVLYRKARERGSRGSGPGPGGRSGWPVRVTAVQSGRAPWAGSSHGSGLPGLSWAAAWSWDGAHNHILSLPCPTGHSLWPENFLVPET